MVIAFLQAEIFSSRYSEYILGNLRYNQLSRTDLIDHPNLENESENNIRRELLKIYRGFGANAYLFVGFPADVAWRFVEIEPKDHHVLLFANEDSWIGISDGARSVDRATGSMDRCKRAHTATSVRAFQQDITDGKSTAPVIL